MPDLFFDTTVLIGYFKDEETTSTALVESVLAKAKSAAISVITVAEVIAASDMNDSLRSDQRLAILKALEWVSADGAVAQRAGELRRQHHLALPDAFIAACAEQSGSDFYSKDPHFRRLLDAQILVGTIY